MGKNYPGIFGRWWSSAFRLTTPIFVARGPALLFGISRWLSQHGISRKRRNNLTRVLIAIERSTQSPKRTRLIHRPAKDIVALLYSGGGGQALSG